jgi:hypothetical protein
MRIRVFDELGRQRIEQRLAVRSLNMLVHDDLNELPR